MYQQNIIIVGTLFIIHSNLSKHKKRKKLPRMIVVFLLVLYVAHCQSPWKYPHLSWNKEFTSHTYSKLNPKQLFKDWMEFNNHHIIMIHPYKLNKTCIYALFNFLKTLNTAYALCY